MKVPLNLNEVINAAFPLRGRYVSLDCTSVWDYQKTQHLGLDTIILLLQNIYFYFSFKIMGAK